MSDLLIELVRCYSPSEHEAPAVDYLVAWMQAHGFVASVDEVGNAVGIRGPMDAPQTLMLLGHIDTVPSNLPVRVEEGILYGRGSVDAKGSLCAFAETTAQAELPSGWRVVVVGAVEEEATSTGARHICDQFSPDRCVIGEPSGAGRLTLGYKGHALIEYTLTRPTAHTSRPEPMVGALGTAFWEAIRAWCATQNDGTTRNFDRVFPALRAINTTSDGLADTVRLTVGFRLPPDLMPDDVLAAVSAVAEPDAVLSMHNTAQAYLGSKNNPLVRGMLAALRAEEHRPGFVLKGGTSDMNIVGAAWACPVIAYGPGDSALDHTPDERLSLAEYAQAVAVLRHMIEHLD